MIPGKSYSVAGTAYAGLTNNGGSTVTITNPSPSLTIRAYGSTMTSTAFASSSIGLGSTTASGSCSGVEVDYYDVKATGVPVNSLQPGRTSSVSGSFTIYVNGG